jgi:hypothetical protein
VPRPSHDAEYCFEKRSQRIVVRFEIDFNSEGLLPNSETEFGKFSSEREKGSVRNESGFELFRFPVGAFSDVLLAPVH